MAFLAPSPRTTRTGTPKLAPVDRLGEWTHVVDFSSGPRHSIRPVRVDARTFCDACGVELRETDPMKAETATEKLARLEREMGADFTRWQGTDAGQSLLADAAREVREARRFTRRIERSEARHAGAIQA